MVAERTNQEWLAELRGSERDRTLVDLRTMLIKGLCYAIAGQSGAGEADLEDSVQGAFLKVLARLGRLGSSIDLVKRSSMTLTWIQARVSHVASLCWSGVAW